jgi:hypothetical protein
LSEDPVFLNPTSQGKEVFTIFLVDPQSQNSYSYAKNNPITISDPDGKFAPIIAAAAGMIALYGPQINTFAQSLLTPVGQYGLIQAGEDAQKGNYGMAVFGAVTAGEMGGEAKAAGTISKNAESLIQIGKKELEHVIEGHAWNTVLEKKSTFLKGIDPVKLINEASKKVGEIQSSTGNMQRTVTGFKNIGVDVTTKQVTNTYTLFTKVLRDGKEALVTIFPGVPRK